MRFQWPEMLWLLGAVPALVAGYVLLVRRRRTAVAALGHLMVEQGTAGRVASLRRHLPPALLALSLLAAIVAAARPVAMITLPSHQQTIILAVDVSLSMRAKDVEPDRFTAAKNAAKAFVRELPPRLRVGIVSFAGTASLAQPPTRNSEDLVGAIDRFQLQRATATGSAIIVSLATLFPDQISDLGAALFGPGGRHGTAGPHGATVPQAAEKARKAEARPFEPVPAGSDTSVAIVLLSDGRRTTGPDPLDAAQLAAERGVRVFTVGFGTEEGAEVDLGGWSAYMKLDEEALKAVAELTHGEYFFAGSEAALRNIYQGLSSKLVLERKQTEISSFFAAAAAVLALLSAGLSVAWYGRIA